VILSRAASAPHEVALDDGTRRRSWRELDDRVRRIAHWLRDGLALAPASHSRC
jgi:acyl-CoA synthetase (AMP-forming)/AMP-acid ligase II